MAGTHNPTLVLVSVLIAAFASYAALALASRVTAARGRFRTAWLVGGSFAMGVGIWSMHFVGMLAFRLPVPITYDVPLWLLSMGVAVAASALALYVTSRAWVPPPRLAVAGGLMGAAIAGMHYVGMAAMRIPGRIEYRPALVVASVAVAVAASWAALRLALRFRADETERGRRMKAGAAAVMGLAIAGMHYTAMAAARFTLTGGDVRVPHDHVLRTEGLAGGVTIATAAVLGVTLLSALADRRARARSSETEALRRSEDRFRSLVVATAQIVWAADPRGEFVERQPEWETFTGMAFDAYRGWGWLQAVHPDDRERAADGWRRALARRTMHEAELRLRRADGAWRHASIRAVPVLEPGGRVREWVGACTDVTERRRTELARDFLADASRVLVSSLDYAETLRTVARLAVPGLADWCAVDVVDEDGRTQRLAVEHTDPEKVRLAMEVERRWPSDPQSGRGVPYVVRTGRSELVPEIPDALLESAARDEEHLRMVRALGLRSYLVVPLEARGRVLGAISLVSAESGRRYDETDLALAEELGRRAAVAVDNARLFRETEESRAQLEQQAAELEEAQAEMEMAHDELQRANEALVQRTEEAERAREAADEANAAKSAFLATMSHELRTPLNAISGYTQLLEMGLHGPVNEKQAEYLDKIARNQTHLLGLINDVLNFAKIEAGQVRYEIAEVAVDGTLSAIEALIEPQLRAKGHRYVFRPGDPAVTVCADRERMEQVVLNLLTNAVKFTEPGGRIELSWTADASRVRIRVSDTGRGIPKDKLRVVFEPFVQVDPALTRSTEGTGLGLAISRDLARAMKGDLTVESTEGTGSVFTLTLPRGRDRAGAAEEEARPKVA
ncbi:MAG TPA: MHYT domain-containing protein [Longimicrobium sp.]|nr:MHYT domain-containing protein [Longimicrobium sp.]